MTAKGKRKTWLLIALGGAIVGFSAMLALEKLSVETSTNDYCMSCHVHTQADADWKKSIHYNNESGVVTDCAACHLPPKEDGLLRYYMTKARTGAKDLWSYWTKDTDKIDWQARREVEYATGIVFNATCEKCHLNLYPEGVTDDGITAHLYYEENARKLDLQCISCHLDAGHEIPGYQHKTLEGKVETVGTIYDSLATVEEFSPFTETVPGTNAAIRMIAIPGGSFTIGSSPKEPYHRPDEGPQRTVRISPFFMGETEVTWQQYWAFYNETMSEGRTPPEVIYANNSRPDVDAVSGPTPPFGFPDQGWGMGDRPAITMTHYAAETFCQWLSLKTGRKYRLPTEAEWEYAARAGTESPYFFEGDPRKYSLKRTWNRWFGADTSIIGRYVVYAGNSRNQTEEPSSVAANPFGLKNMLGNVMEYCADWYVEDAYTLLEDGMTDPRGPEDGTKFVVRGGSYSDDASRVRCASRGHTLHDAWLRTDPQNPKSIWWYSDIKGVGFRVVCEVPEGVTVNEYF